MTSKSWCTTALLERNSAESIEIAARGPTPDWLLCVLCSKVKAIPTKKYGADLVRFTHDKASHPGVQQLI
jgi:hypothetical protein